MSARKSSHGTISLILSSGSPLALIASSLRSTSKKPFCPMTRSLHRPYPRAVTESDSRALGERNFSRRPSAGTAPSAGGNLLAAYADLPARSGLGESAAIRGSTAEQRHLQQRSQYSPRQ